MVLPSHEHPTPDAQAILQHKNELEAHWRALPPEHQATMGLVLIKDILNGEYSGWLLDALAILSAPPADDISGP